MKSHLPVEERFQIPGKSRIDPYLKVSKTS